MPGISLDLNVIASYLRIELPRGYKFTKALFLTTVYV